MNNYDDVIDALLNLADALHNKEHSNTTDEWIVSELSNIIEVCDE